MIRKFGRLTPQVPDSCFIADGVELIGDVRLGENVNLWYGSVIRADINRIEIGADTNIQDGSVIHVDTAGPDPDTGAVLIGRNVTVGHKALLHACRIGDNCLIGMGAIILSGAEIGEGCIVAAGSVVRENEKIPSGSLVAGLPAKIKGLVAAEWREKILVSASRYVELGRQHKELIA
jgi:carbonic anhydrase/acetyltransferase-like protein (isoleucine patch superfamily)